MVFRLPRDHLPDLHVHSLLLLVLLGILSPPPSSSNYIDPSALLPDAPPCYNSSIIQYPFAIVDPNNTSLGPLPPRRGFELSCGGSAPALSLPSAPARPYVVLDISILSGYVRIVGRAVAWRCYDNSSGASLPPPDRGLSLRGTPYTFSDAHNKFTAVGCDAMVLMLAQGGGANHRYSGGCVSFCATNDSIVSGACSGVGCCQVSLPKGLKSLNFSFTSIRSLTGSTHKDQSGEPCSKAFIVDEDYYAFSKKDLVGNPEDQYRPMVLEWSIGEETCAEVTRKRGGEFDDDYACKGNSYCYDSTNGIGYRCNCSRGFRGILTWKKRKADAKCADPKTNPCVHKCINTVGGFNCTCPFGISGDGLRAGSGCEGLAPLAIGLVAGLGLLAVLLALGFWAEWFRKKRKQTKLRQKFFLQNGGSMLRQQIFSQKAPARIFTSEELRKATDNFSKDRILGRGGYGTVYKGVLSDQTVVAIKKSKMVDQTQIEQFVNEVVILSQINHRNVVKLLGCCLETQVPLLVYEFISNGTLFNHLHSNQTAPMPWEDRLRIAVETAASLAYLHSATKVPIIHRDVKSANILLDECYNAKVSDFGASRLVPYDQTHITTVVQGTLGYLDPEYFSTSLLTDKSDVYSFGVVLIEILTREMPISFCRSEEGRNLASHFTMLVEQNRLLEMLDQRVVKEAGVRHLNEIPKVALRCLRIKGEERPKMKEVLVELDALRRLMKQHSAEKSQEKLNIPPQSQIQKEISADGPSALCCSNSQQDSLEDALPLSMDFPW
uniref:Protein kinase domain-containing protein n=1 Tax=Ananas comosus var. bracteatus TaxID=296719 RepID=A0A6V7QQS7_ANACO|nr:unnamed protein product [Ananas comosus var. bracteatus]